MDPCPLTEPGASSFRGLPALQLCLDLLPGSLFPASHPRELGTPHPRLLRDGCRESQLSWQRKTPQQHRVPGPLRQTPFLLHSCLGAVHPLHGPSCLGPRFSAEQEGPTAPATGQAGVSAAGREKPDPQPCRDPQATVGSRRRPEPGAARGKRPGPRSSAHPGFASGDPGGPGGEGGAGLGRLSASVGPGIPALWVLLHFWAGPRNPHCPPPAHAGSSLPPEAGVATEGGRGGL